MRSLFLALALFFVSVTAIAETIPATAGGNVQLAKRYQASNKGSAGFFDTSGLACQGAYPGRTLFPTGNSAPSSPGNWIDAWCRDTSTNIQDSIKGETYCPSGSSWVSATQKCTTTGYSCPSTGGWTLNGTTCTRPDCPVGYDRDASGLCVKNCTAKANTPTTNGNYDFPGPPSEWSVAGCKVRCKQRVIQYNGGAGYQCYYTGASANPDQPEPEMLPPDPTKLPPESPKDCLNQGQGYVQSSSGSVKCVSGESAPAGQKPKAVESDHSETTGEDTDGDGVPDTNVKKTEGTTTKDDKGEVTDKKTESMDPNPDGTCNAGFIKSTSTGKCEKTTVEKKDLNSFCTDKPDHEICTGKKPAPDPCTENKDRVGCADLGTAPEGVEPGSKDIGVSAITPFAMGGNASCPADIQGPKGITIPFTGVCMYAQGIRPIILALAWIFAGWMVVGAFKS